MTPPSSPSINKGISDQYLITIKSDIIYDIHRDRILKTTSERLANEGIQIVNEYPDVGVLVIKASSNILDSTVNNILEELQRDLRIEISVEQDREEKIL